MPLKKLNKYLRWYLVIQILLTVTSAWEATIAVGFICFALGIIYCQFTNWFYSAVSQVG